MAKPVTSAEVINNPGSISSPENTSAEKPVESTEVKAAYKPRFNMKNTGTKPPEK